MGVGAVDEWWDSVRDAVELPLRCRVAGGSQLARSFSLPLPLPLAVEVLPPGVALLLVLLWRSLPGSNLARLVES